MAWAALEPASKEGAAAAEATHDASPSRADESAAAQALRSRLLSLQRYLTGTSEDEDPEAHQLVQKAINVAIGYIAGYQDVRAHLIGLDAEQRGAAEVILRARPLKGEIDYAELSREHIARYPKIRTALGK